MGKVVEAGKKAMAMSHQNQRTGPSVKNLGPSAVKKPNPAGQVRSMGGMNLKGPDKGAGGS